MKFFRYLFSVFLPALAVTTLLSAVACQGQTQVIKPEGHGARGDGRSDDTAALQAAIDAAANGTLEIDPGKVYLVSAVLWVKSPLHLNGGGTIKAAGDIESTIGTGGRDSLISFAESASGSSIENIEIDMSGKGRNAIHLSASNVHVDNLRIRNYFKNKKADRRLHNKSESGLRISASNVIAKNVYCENMRTTVPDAVPRCVTVHGNASGVRLENITGHKINGGITIGASTNTQIHGYEFRDLTDNGLYILPGSVGLVAKDGYLENTEEPVVFKGKNSTVSGLRIPNQGHTFGLDNADGVLLENVKVSFDENLKTRPAFVRARRKNEYSKNIRIRSIDASMPLGSSVINLVNGVVENISVTNSTFSMYVDKRKSGKANYFVIRQRRGDFLDLIDTTFRFHGPGAKSISTVAILAPGPVGANAKQILETNKFVSDRGPISLLIKEKN